MPAGARAHGVRTDKAVRFLWLYCTVGGRYPLHPFQDCSPVLGTNYFGIFTGLSPNGSAVLKGLRYAVLFATGFRPLARQALHLTHNRIMSYFLVAQRTRYPVVANDPIAVRAYISRNRNAQWYKAAKKQRRREWLCAAENREP